MRNHCWNVQRFNILFFLWRAETFDFLQRTEKNNTKIDRFWILGSQSPSTLYTAICVQYIQYIYICIRRRDKSYLAGFLLSCKSYTVPVYALILSWKPSLLRLRQFQTRAVNLFSQLTVSFVPVTQCVCICIYIYKRRDRSTSIYCR